MKIRNLINYTLISSTLLTSGCAILLYEAYMPKISEEQRKENEKKRLRETSILNEYLSRSEAHSQNDNYTYRIVQTQNSLNSEHVIEYVTYSSYIKENSQKKLYVTINKNTVYIYDILMHKLHKFELNDLEGYSQDFLDFQNINISDNMEDFLITYREQSMDYSNYPQSVKRVYTNKYINSKVNIYKKNKILYREIRGSFCENKDNTCKIVSNNILLADYGSNNLARVSDDKNRRYVVAKDRDEYKYYRYDINHNRFSLIMKSDIDPKKFKGYTCPSFIMREYDYISCTISTKENQKSSNIEIKKISFNGDILSSFNTDKFIKWGRPTITFDINRNLIIRGSSSDDPKIVTNLLLKTEGDLIQNKYTLEESEKNSIRYRGGEAEHLYSIQQKANSFTVKDLDTTTGRTIERNFSLFPLIGNGMNLVFSISEDGKTFITDAYNINVVIFK